MVTTNGIAPAALELEGTVQSVHGNGFRLQGRAGYLNLSKFAEVTLPHEGDHVLVTLDKSGFVRQCTVLGSTAPQDAPQGAETPASGPVCKDRQIARMNALGHAVAILSSAAAVNVDDVLTLAARLEKWILR